MLIQTHQTSETASSLPQKCAWCGIQFRGYKLDQHCSEECRKARTSARHKAWQQSKVPAPPPPQMVIPEPRPPLTFEIRVLKLLVSPRSSREIAKLLGVEHAHALTYLNRFVDEGIVEISAAKALSELHPHFVISDAGMAALTKHNRAVRDWRRANEEQIK